MHGTLNSTPPGRVIVHVGAALARRFVDRNGGPGADVTVLGSRLTLERSTFY
jgi:hypothetical protein